MEALVDYCCLRYIRCVRLLSGFMDVSPLHSTFRPLDVSPPGRFAPSLDVSPPTVVVSPPSVDCSCSPPLVSCNFRNVHVVLRSHTSDKYLVAHLVFLSDVLNDVIGVTSNCRPCSIQLPYAILPRLRFTASVFSKAENLGRFYDPPGR